MLDARKLLDVLTGTTARIGHPGDQGRQPGALQRQAAMANLGSQIMEKVQQIIGRTPEQLMQKAKQVIERNPGLAQAAAIGLAGILLGRSKRGLSTSIAKLGGLALIGGLAYKAWQAAKAGRPFLGMGGAEEISPIFGQGSRPAVAASAGTPPPGRASSDTFHILDVPERPQFHPVSRTEDDALLFLRAMVAAASADGHIDGAERSRIVKGLTEAGIDPEATRWLDREMAAPADVEELSAGITSLEKAAQVYTAARVAIDPDTIQEREFLRQLAEALDLDQGLKAQIDDTASAARMS